MKMLKIKTVYLLPMIGASRKCYYLTYLFLISSACAFGQTRDIVLIKGSVKDTEGRSIPFSSISIEHAGEGTAANAQGDFTVNLDAKYRKGKLVISSIGYASRFIRIDSLLSTLPRQTIFYLRPDIISLDEIIVKERKIEGAEILKLAIENFPRNYLQSPFNLFAYSTIVVDNPEMRAKFSIESA